MVWLLALLLCGRSQAAEPQRWAVHGVAANDTLTVRREPNARAPVVGKLAPTAADLLEVAHNEEGWVRVRAGAVEGWVNGAYLSPLLPSDGALPARLLCRGTEPYWTVLVEGGMATYRSPAQANGLGVPVSTAQTANRAGFLVSAQSKAAGWSWLVVELAPATCSDGMSTARLPYRAFSLTEEAGFVAGCCEVPR